MAAPTDLGAAVRPTCTTNRHTASNYTKRRCRCAVGRRAWMVYRELWRTGRRAPELLDATGSRRQVQGLMSMGHSRRAIAAAGDLRPGVVGDLAYARYATVTPAVAAAVRRAAATLGASVGSSSVTRSRALAAGHVPLWAWDDDIDDPAAKPQGVLYPVRTPMPALDVSARARFEARRQPQAGGCVRWDGAVDELGHGILSIAGRTGGRTTVRARRYAFLLSTGREPVGMVHACCGNGWCCAGPHMVDEAAARRKAAA